MATEKRLIDANTLCDLLDVEYERKMKLVRKGENHLDTLAEGIMSMSVLLGTMPTVDAVEVVHGRWIDSYVVKKLQYDRYPTVKCSSCGCYFCDVINNHHFMYHYCPNCGAKMDGDSR